MSSKEKKGHGACDSQEQYNNRKGYFTVRNAFSGDTRSGCPEQWEQARGV